MGMNTHLDEDGARICAVMMLAGGCDLYQVAKALHTTVDEIKRLVAGVERLRPDDTEAT